MHCLSTFLYKKQSHKLQHQLQVFAEEALIDEFSIALCCDRLVIAAFTMKTAWSNTAHALGTMKDAEAEELAAVFDDEDISDTVVLCKGGNVYVCKTLLVARSPYFKSLIAFNSNANAVKRSADLKYKIDWTAHSSEVARALLLYLYTGKCTVHDQRIDDLIDLAAQVFVKTQRFELLLATLMDSMLRRKNAKEQTRCEINTMLERMFKHTDSLPGGTGFVNTVLQCLGGGADLWRKVFTVPMTVDVAVLKRLKSDNCMQELAQVEESTVLALLQWATQLRSADDKLTDTRIVFDLLTWCCARSAGSDAVREPFRALLKQGKLDLQCVDPAIIKQYVEPVGALSVEELLSVYRAQATRPCCNAKGANCSSYPSWLPLKPGAKLDVLDPVNKWYISEVLQVTTGQVLVHYINWSSTFDEWIPVCSPRLAPVNTHTTGPRIRPT
jgi:BTB/POZ domain